MSSEGEMSEPEYSQESQGAEYLAEVVREAESLQGEDSKNSSDSLYTPNASVADSDEDEEDLYDAAEVLEDWPADWPKALHSADLAHLVIWQKDVMDRVEIAVAAVLALREAPGWGGVPRGVRALVRDTHDFWMHVQEEYSDHLNESVRRIKRIESKLQPAE